MDGKRRVLYGMTICMTTIALVMGICLLYFANQAHSDVPLTFTAQEWDVHPYRRHRMVDSLMEQYHFTGMKKSAVEELLGENRRIGYPDGYQELAYVIGWGAKGRDLLIFYLEDGRVKLWDYGVYRD